MNKNIFYRYLLSNFKPLNILLTVALVIAVFASALYADIYRFVTIDGVETFTDAPLNKDAQVVIKENLKTIRKGNYRGAAKREVRKSPPSLKEIVEKTVQAHITPGANNEYLEPMFPVTGVISSGVGVRIDPIDGVWRHHNGIDIAVPTGTPVKSVANGTVVYAGFRSGYGWTVLVEHDNGMITLYGHNSQIIIEAGKSVKRGDTIALAGSTGRSTGPHVHFEAWQSGSNITPAFMPGSGVKIASTTSSPRTRVSFRREILADGSLLITNIPQSVP